MIVVDPIYFVVLVLPHPEGTASYAGQLPVPTVCAHIIGIMCTQTVETGDITALRT